MSLAIAIIAPGAMGAGIGRRLSDNGAAVMTALEGRSDDSVARAEAAGMRGVEDTEIARAEIILSVVPPASATEVAECLAPILRQSELKPIYVECNAVSPETVGRIETVIASTGCAFVDGGIVGPPPKPGGHGPRLYVSGEAASRLGVLADHGLDVRVLNGPVGKASALKLSYAGITKGLTAIAAVMLLGAARAGVDEDLLAELADSQPELLRRFESALPRMYPKAYRWVAEMKEIAAFLDGESSGATIYEGAARIYERLAADVATDRHLIASLDAFFVAKNTESTEDLVGVTR